MNSSILGIIVASGCMAAFYALLIKQLRREQWKTEKMRQIYLEQCSVVQEYQRVISRKEATCDKQIKWKERAIDTLAAHARSVNRAAMARKWVRHIGRITLASGRAGIWSRRFYVIESEMKELREAMYQGDKKAYIDALGDLSYAVDVSCLLLGVDPNELYRRIHVSNMTKDPLQFKRDDHGKGWAFVPPVLDDLVPGGVQQNGEH